MSKHWRMEGFEPQKDTSRNQELCVRRNNSIPESPDSTLRTLSIFTEVVLRYSTIKF
jgi:hypothetical protein